MQDIYPSIHRDNIVSQPLGPYKSRVLNPNEIDALRNANLSHAFDEKSNTIFIYQRIKIGRITFISELYTRQTKRDNHTIVWNNNTSYRVIKFIISMNNSLYTIV